MPFPAPLVTCVMTAFNDAAFVERAVASALGQAGLPEDAVEVVVVDDGSTDGTIERVEALGGPVRVLRQERRGPSVGMHRGIDAAAGRYVSMLDADDEWLPNKLSSSLAILATRPGVGLVYGDCEHIDPDGRVIAPSHFGANGMVPPAGRVLGRFVERNYATTTMITIPTDLARAVPVTPDWAWCRDWWFAAQIARTHELDYVTEPITRYRLHGSNMSASDDGQPEKTLRLFHRDLKVRRIFMREFDLAETSLDELLAAWRRHVHYIGVLVRHRGTTPGELLPVTDEDRAEGADALAAARAAFDGDPVAAGQAAFRALGADPFSADAQTLLARAHARAAADGRERPPLRSVAQSDRLRDLDARRAAIPAAVGLPDRLRAYHRFESLRRTLVASGTPASDTDHTTAEQRDHALDAVATGLHAGARGRHEEAVLALAAAVAHTPGDGHARIALDDAFAALGSRAPQRGSAEARAALRPAPLGELDGVRTFVGLAWADELAADPALLATWAETFGADDDATLVIYAPGGDEDEVVHALGPALAAAGIGDDDGRDLALVIGAATPEREAGLTRGACVALTRRGPSGPFAALAALDTPGALRDASTRRLAYDGVGRPLSVAIKLCVPRSDDAVGSRHLPLACAIADALARRGHMAVVQPAEDWNDGDARACDVALHLRGPWPYVPGPGETAVLWPLADAAADVTEREAARFAAVLDGGEDVGAGVAALLDAVTPRIGAAHALAG